MFNSKLSKLSGQVITMLWGQSKKGGKDQESIQPSTTSDPGYHMGKWQNPIKHRKQDPRDQPFPSRWPQGAKAWQTQDILNNTNDPHVFFTC